MTPGVGWALEFQDSFSGVVGICDIDERSALL